MSRRGPRVFCGEGLVRVRWQFTVDGKRINRVRQLIEDAKEMRLELQRPIVLVTMAVRHSWLDGIADADAAALVGENRMHERWVHEAYLSIASPRVPAGTTRKPVTAAASEPLAQGTRSVPMPRRRQASATASEPRTGWICPSSANSPTTAKEPTAPSLTHPVAARIPRAMGRSDAAPSFRRSAGSG
jgi:hypothetical protein